MPPKTKSTKAKSEPIEELDDDDLELTDDDDADDEEAAPAPKAKKGKPAKAAAPKRESTALGAAWLATHVNDQLGTEYTPAQIRVILRKLAKDDESPVEREVGTDRARYAFTGENDKSVKAVVRAIKSGALDREKADRIAAARAAKAEADETPAPKAKKAKKAAPVEDEAPAPKATRKRK